MAIWANNTFLYLMSEILGVFQLNIHYEKRSFLAIGSCPIEMSQLSKY
mgnify:CR=1 FL=1